MNEQTHSAPAPTPLLKLLQLEPVRPEDIEVNQTKREFFNGKASFENHVRAFGGHVGAQAVVAAAHSVAEDRTLHSMHSYFLRPGNTTDPITYDVEHLRDGRAFSTRAVRAIQNDKLIFVLHASFHRDENGPDYSLEMPNVPAPEDLPTFQQRFADRQDMTRWLWRASAFDIRYVSATPFDEAVAEQTSTQTVWFRANTTQESDCEIDAINKGIITYASDMTILDAALMRHGMQWTDRSLMGATLDHSLWFHSSFRADDWLLFQHEVIATHGGRGTVRLTAWKHDGQVVMSGTQEALLRSPWNLGDTN